MSETPIIGVSLDHPDGTVEWLYKPTPKQIEGHECTAANLLMEGSRGTGKSVWLRWDAHMRAMATPGWTGVILRRTYPELSKSHLIFIEAEAKKLGAVYHRSERVVIYPNGSKLFFSHCEDESAVLNLLSAQFVWMGIDEATTFEWTMIVKLASSVRVPEGSGLIAMLRLTTNPLGESVDDIWKYYVDKDVDPEEDAEYNPEDYHSIHTILADNPHLDAKQYVKRFAGLPPHVKKAWLDGERVFERSLFQFHPTKNGKPYHVINELPTYKDENGITRSILTLPWVRIYRAYDHGFYPDPAVCLWFVVYGRRIIVFREDTWYSTIAKKIAIEIVQMGKKHLKQRVTDSFCDPSIHIQTGADVRTIKEIMEDEGLPLECAINDRELFANVIHNGLNEEVEPGIPRVQILRSGDGFAHGCPCLVKFLPQMRYDIKHPKKMADHKADHWPIAFAYFLMSHIPVTKETASTVPLPAWMRKAKKKGFVLGREGVRAR